MEIKIGIIGLGYVGLPLARLFATKFSVVGFDINQERVNQLNQGLINFSNQVELFLDKKIATIPGAGAEILSDRVRDIIAPKKMDTQEWLEVHRLAHSIGMKTTATMMFGTVETDEETDEEIVKKATRKVGMLFVRGDIVVLVSPPLRTT